MINGGIRVLPFGVASTLFQYSRDFCAVVPGKKTISKVQSIQEGLRTCSPSIKASGGAWPDTSSGLGYPRID